MNWTHIMNYKIGWLTMIAKFYGPYQQVLSKRRVRQTTDQHQQWNSNPMSPDIPSVNAHNACLSPAYAKTIQP